MEALQTSRGKTCVVAAGAATLAVAYGAFHNWIWKCHYLSFPAYRASHPTPWRSLRSHKLTLVRLWRFATAPLRRLPDFYIIGAPKAGSSALHDYLIKHPNILPPCQKETRFIFGSCGRWLSKMAYRSMFPLRLTNLFDNTVTFDADVCIGHCPEMAAAMIARFTPNAKAILCHREPVDRALSIYNFLHRLKGSPFDGKSFQEAFDTEKGVLDSPVWSEVEQHTASFDSGKPVRISSAFSSVTLRVPMLKPGHYAEILSAFQKRLGAENCKAISFKDFTSSTEDVVKSIFEFLNLRDYELPKLDKIMPEEVMDCMVLGPKRENSVVSEKEKEMLTSYYATHRLEFAKLLGMDVDSIW